MKTNISTHPLIHPFLQPSTHCSSISAYVDILLLDKGGKRKEALWGKGMEGRGVTRFSEEMDADTEGLEVSKVGPLMENERGSMTTASLTHISCSCQGECRI